MSQKLRHPEIEVALASEDPKDVFANLWLVDDALRRNGVDRAERDEFIVEATGKDASNVLDVCKRWVRTI